MRHPAGEIADRLHLLGWAELLLGAAPLGDVLESAEKLSRIAGLVMDQLPFAVNMPHLAVRSDDPAFKRLGTSARSCFRSTGQHNRLIFRVDQLENVLLRYHECLATNPKNPIALIGPFPLTGSQIAQIDARSC